MRHYKRDDLRRSDDLKFMRDLRVREEYPQDVAEVEASAYVKYLYQD